ncbi:MAG: deoxyribodipyrimidine photo-lyase, partial [Bacteroidales bacterium]|nr:deoxyribodipyrimidine photo-lyase [Bacteroidales bacterium]
RRDLSLYDNHGLLEALNSGIKVLPLFIFDTEILDELDKDDSRVSFIYKTLSEIDIKLKLDSSSILIRKGKVEDVFTDLISDFEIMAVYSNEDYEPYAINRDKVVTTLLEQNGIKHLQFKNQVVFAKDEILKKDKKPYTIFTPYKNAWLEKFKSGDFSVHHQSENFIQNFVKFRFEFPELSEIGFTKGKHHVKEFNHDAIKDYHNYRDFPSKDLGTYLGPHLRFGTISIRQLMREYFSSNETFISELIWREFFMQILYHFPKSEKENFKKQYDTVKWRNNEDEFEKWCKGETGYPIVDAGMRQLNSTGYMHNRVRMITASFLCKHLLIDWRWGEAYFAAKLLDYELSSNVGNWQWAASTGCDAVPYFRIFNPITQQQKFDPNFDYVKQFVPNFVENKPLYKIIDHDFARKRALETYKNTD